MNPHEHLSQFLARCCNEVKRMIIFVPFCGLFEVFLTSLVFNENQTLAQL